MLRKSIPLLALALLGLAVVTPLLAILHLPLLVFAVRQFFAAVCHERPERSFWIAGQPIAICVRCFGIYCGVALGALVRLPRMQAIKGLGIAVLLSVADIASEALGLHGNLPAVRLVLGLLLGMMVSALLCAEEETAIYIKINEDQERRSAVGL